MENPLRRYDPAMGTQRQQFEAQVADKDRENDERSTKYIKAAARLEQWKVGGKKDLRTR